MRHSSWRAYSRIGIRWLGVSALVSAGGVAATGIAVAVLAVDLIAVEVALAEKSPNTSIPKSLTASPSPSSTSSSAALQTDGLSATDIADRAFANDSSDELTQDAKPLDRLPPGGWQSESTTFGRR